jgi:hypothetical protein
VREAESAGISDWARTLREYLTGPSRPQTDGPRVVSTRSAGTACSALADEARRAAARVGTVRPHSRSHRTRESGAVSDTAVCYSRNVRKTHRCPLADPVARPPRPPGRSYSLQCGVARRAVAYLQRLTFVPFPRSCLT